MSKIIGKLKKRDYLTPLDSEKKAIHLEIEIQKGVFYEPGDSIAIDVLNSSEEVDYWLKKHQKDPFELVFNKKLNSHISLREHLVAHVNLQSIEDGSLERARPLMPRFYSIASSQSVHSDSIHLLVTLDEFLDEYGILRMGVASHYLSSQLKIDDQIHFKIFPNENFRLPKEDLPIIMIGAGSGLAPYKAFLEERQTRGHTSKSWLIFGERSEESHFYYNNYLKQLQRDGWFILSCAFSRDQQTKIYVQDRLKENSDLFFQLLDQQATLYICGDAKVMARGVLDTIEQMYCEKHQATQDQAATFVKELKKDKRLILDVY